PEIDLCSSRSVCAVRHARQELGVIVEALDLKLVQLFGGEGGDAERRLPQIFAALFSCHHHCFQGCCVRLRERRQGAQCSGSKTPRHERSMCGAVACLFPVHAQSPPSRGDTMSVSRHATVKRAAFPPRYSLTCPGVRISGRSEARSYGAGWSRC